MEVNNHSYSDELEIDLGEILLLMWRRLWLIALCALIAGVAGLGISKFLITPMYESTTQVFVISRTNSDASPTYTDLQIGTVLTKDYPQIIKSRNCLEKVIETLELNATYKSLAGRISVTTPTEGRILAITVTDADPFLAQQIADKVREVASIHIKNVTDIEAMNVVDYANLPTAPSSPSVFKWTVLGAFVGAFICMAIILVQFLLDDTIKTSEEVEKYLGISTLAVIPVADELGAEKEKSRQDRLMRSNEEEGLLDGEIRLYDSSVKKADVQEQPETTEHAKTTEQSETVEE